MLDSHDRVFQVDFTDIIDLLANGTSVVLDFPANTVNQRKWLKGIVVQADAHHEFHYLDSSDESCKAQSVSATQNSADRCLQLWQQFLFKPWVCF